MRAGPIKALLIARLVIEIENKFFCGIDLVYVLAFSDLSDVFNRSVSAS